MTRLAFRAGVPLLAVLATAGIAEIGLRLAGPAWLRERMVAMAAGSVVVGETVDTAQFGERREGAFVRFKPGVAFALLDPEFHTTVHVTDLGTRVTGTEARGAAHVAFLGDSFTFGYGVEDNDAFVSVLCRTMGVACLNLGLPGSTLATEVDLISRRHAEVGRPRLYVVGFFAGNDLIESLTYDARQRDQAPGPRSPARERILALNRLVNTTPWLQRLYVLQLAKSAAVHVLSRDLVAVDPMFQTARDAGGPFGAEARASFARHLDRLVRLRGDDGFEIVFLMIPDRHQVYPAKMEATAAFYGLDPNALDMSFPQRMLAPLLEARGIPYVDLLGCLRASGDPDLYYRMDSHFTANGHRAAARCAVDALRPLVARVAGE